jgi:hypothetical protein
MHITSIARILVVVYSQDHLQGAHQGRGKPDLGFRWPKKRWKPTRSQSDDFLSFKFLLNTQVDDTRSDNEEDEEEMDDKKIN